MMRTYADCKRNYAEICGNMRKYAKQKQISFQDRGEGVQTLTARSKKNKKKRSLVSRLEVLIMQFRIEWDSPRRVSRDQVGHNDPSAQRCSGAEMFRCHMHT